METVFVWTFEGAMQALFLSGILFFILLMLLYAGIDKFRNWLKKRKL